MWTDAEGEVFVGAISADFHIRLSRDELEGAKTRSELKRVWIDNAALLQIRSSVGEVQYKMAYKLSQTREEGAEMCISFSSSPKQRPAKDTVVEASKLAAMNGDDTGEIRNMCFGFAGGVFYNKAGDSATVTGITPATGEDDTITTVQVVLRKMGMLIDEETQDMPIVELLESYAGHLVDGLADLISVAHLPTLISVLEASGLLITAGREMEEPDLVQFLAAVYNEEVNEVGCEKLASQLESLLNGKTALHSGAGWAALAETGVLAEASPAHAGALLRAAWFAQKPELSGKGGELATRGKKRAVAGGGAAVADDGSEDHDDSDIDSDLGGDSEDDMIEDVGYPASAGLKRAPSAAKTSSAKVAKTSGHLKSAVASADLLTKLVPRDASMTALQTVRLFFDEASVRELAGCAEVPPESVTAGHEARYTGRYTGAIQRLILIVGDAWVPPRPPRHEAALEEVVEAVFELVRAHGAAGARPGAAAGATKSNVSQGVFDDDDEKVYKPGVVMEADQALDAVPSAVAASLYAGRAGLPASVDDPVIAMRSVSDAVLRQDLARAVGSNGKVDAPGETANSRRNLLPAVHVVRRQAWARVVQCLHECADSDQQGRQSLADSTAHSLAKAAVMGHFTWAAFVAASKEVHAEATSPKGSLEEMADAFLLLEAAWAPVIEILFGKTRDAGLEALRAYTSSKARQQMAKLSPDLRQKHMEKLNVWLLGVLRAYRRAMESWRHGAAAEPSVMACVQQQQTHYQFNSAVAAMWSEMPAQQQQAGRAQRGDKTKLPKRKPVLKAAITRPGAKPAKGKKNKRGKTLAARAAAAAEEGEGEEETEDEETPELAPFVWQNKPQMPNEKWQELMTNFKAKWPTTCSYHCLSRCKQTSSSCRFSHDVPNGFLDWAKAQAE